jgi:hypothetical protein
MRVTTGLAVLALVAGLAGAQDGRGSTSEPGSIEDVLERRPGAGDLVLESRDPQRPTGTTADEPSAWLPYLAFESDAVVRAYDLELRGDWLRLAVAEYLWGKGPDELFVRNAAFSRELVDAQGAGEWIVFLAVEARGMAAIGAIDRGVVPLTAGGHRPRWVPAGDGTQRLPGFVRQLLACRAQAATQSTELVRGWAGCEPEAHLLALQLAAMLARDPRARDASAAAWRHVAVLWSTEVVPFGLATPAGGCTPLKYDSTVSDGADRPGESATSPWITAARELFPLAPPALALRRMLEPFSVFAGLHEHLLQVLLGSAAARLGVPEPDGVTREARTDWLREHWRALLALDQEFVDEALAGNDPLDQRTAATVVRLHGGPTEALPEPSTAAERAAFLEAFRAWCAASTGP